MNKVILIGRLGMDPETKTFEDGRNMTKVSIATSRRYKSKNGEKVEKTEWHNAVFFGKASELIRDYFKKGDPIMVEGMIEYREYEKDGVKKYFTQIVCDSFEFLPKPTGSETAPAPATSTEQKTPAGDGKDDDLPF